MTCANCEGWAAKSLEQLRRRLRNIEEHPEVTPHVCPNCKGTDWATTEEFIKKPSAEGPLKALVDYYRAKKVARRVARLLGKNLGDPK